MLPTSLKQTVLWTDPDLLASTLDLEDTGVT